jgi:hypothetical protein
MSVHVDHVVNDLLAVMFTLDAVERRSKIPPEVRVALEAAERVALLAVTENSLDLASIVSPDEISMFDADEIRTLEPTDFISRSPLPELTVVVPSACRLACRLEVSARFEAAETVVLPPIDLRNTLPWPVAVSTPVGAEIVTPLLPAMVRVLEVTVVLTAAMFRSLEAEITVFDAEEIRTFEPVDFRSRTRAALRVTEPPVEDRLAP